MQLKKIEMCGFKSFANRTEIAFDRGVTGIVGPNGCGKSNVVDAIKWVLGTLSYKSVRGEEMADVIFKGAEGVPAMGFAEVSLTLDNSDHTLPLEFEEVVITRRLFRDGQGAYFLNKAPCRLKDIRDLLYGTGIGTDNYSVIEQGKIDRLVLSNPHERRVVFDEAAGISRYRARRKETEGRLEKVTQDLLRIGDVVSEVQKQLRSVRAQAGRAALWRRLQEEWREKRRRLLVHEYRGLQARGREIAGRLEVLAAEEARLRSEIGAQAGIVEEARRKLDAESARQAELESALAGLQSRQEYQKRSVEQALSRRGELEEEARKLEAERSGQEARVRELDRRIEEEGRLREDLARQEAERQAEAEELGRRLEEAAAECARASAELEERRAEAVELARKEAQYRNERESLERDRAAVEAQLARRRERAAAAEGEQAGIRAQLEEVARAREAVEREIADLKNRLHLETEARSALAEERARLERELVDLREAKDHRVARRETLRSLEEQLEGLDSGAQALLRERPEGVRGTVADFLRVAPDRVAAVEGALGAWAGAVVLETGAQAARAAEWVRARGLGRTLLVALDGCDPGPLPEDELALGGVLGRADAWGTAEEEFRILSRALLGRVLVVQDASTAQEIHRARLTELPLVTPEGDFFERPGMFVAAGARPSPGLLSRKAELRRLEEEIDRYLALVRERERRQEEADRRIQVADEKLELLRQRIYELSVMDLGELNGRAEQLSVRDQLLGKERETLAGEIAALEEQAAATVRRSAALESLLAQMAWLKSQVEGEIAGLKGTLERYEQGRGELERAQARAREQAIKGGEQRRAAEERLEFLRRDRAESAGALERLEERRSGLEARREGAEEERRRLEAELEDLGRRLEEGRGRLEESARRRGELAAAAEAARAEAGRLEAALGPVLEETGRLRTEEEVHRLRTETLAQKGREELGLDLPEAAAAEGPEEEGVDWEAAAREVEEIRARIAGFGAVNVESLDQLRDLEEREKFMISQKEDLEKTKAQLEDLIRQLNQESRELFDKTLGFVREQFNTIFRKIFGGGKAEIVLEEAEGVDPMEQGLEIRVRPPQKEQTSISLLSGGERSLTAIALVMALFKANPSPFCLLDEADAALDEGNVGRFASLVREFAADTQFIVITHNKRTMAVCDVLYGVTMEQPGISKKVSVNLSGDGFLDRLRARPAPSGAPGPEPAVAAAPA